MNWNGLMLDDQINRLVGECWVSDVDAIVWWKVCEKKHRKAEKQAWSKNTERHTHESCMFTYWSAGLTLDIYHFFLQPLNFCDDSCAKTDTWHLHLPVLWFHPCDAGASKCCHRFVSGSKGGPVDLTIRSPCWDLVGYDFSMSGGWLKGRNCFGEFSSFQSSTVLGL